MISERTETNLLNIWQRTCDEYAVIEKVMASDDNQYKVTLDFIDPTSYQDFRVELLENIYKYGITRNISKGL